MLEGRSLQAALQEIMPQPFEGTLFRCVSLRALLGLIKDSAGNIVITRPNPNFLYANGPVSGGGRFTAKGGARSLYMAESAHTAKLEKRRAAGFGTAQRKVEPIEVNYALHGKLLDALDLTDADVAEKLETSRSEIVPLSVRADGKTSPTHILGTEVVRSKRFSAIRYPSAANPRGKCIVVFPERLRTGESVSVLDEDSIINQIVTVAAAI